jgi:hypothetical protein
MTPAFLARSAPISVLIVAAVCAAQTAPKRPIQKKRPAHSAFACPDSEAQQACKSYLELLKVKDTGLPDNAYVCFRKNADEFFLISFSKPYFRKNWDQDSRQTVVDYDYTPPGRGSARTFKNGVEDSTVMPTLFFSGRWTPSFIPDEGTFVSEKINQKKPDESDPDVGVSIDESQVNIRYKYQNRLDKNIHYFLTIQRSTGRFAESFYYEEAAKMPFLEGVGYCVHHTGG